MELIKRLQSPTPAFHKKLRNLALTLVGIAGALLAADAASEAFELTAMVSQICQYVVIIGGAVAGTAQTPVVDGKIND